MKSEVRSQKSETVLVCFALKEEAAPFRKIASNKSGFTILFTGIGKINAEKSVRDFLTIHSPRLVLSCGFAGGLNPDLDLGAVIFATEDETLRQQLIAANARPANFFCTAQIAITVAEKNQLRQKTGADAVEMESEAIRSVCRERGIPCATVRVVSDTAKEDLPLDFNQFSKPDLSLDYGKLAWAIAKSPWKIGALLRLRKRCRFAAEQLAEVLRKIIFP